MKAFSVVLITLVFAAASVKAQVWAEWTQKPTDEKITIVDAGGKATVLEPGVVTPADVTKRIRGGVDWAFRVRGATADTVVASPITIDLGGIIPRKRNFLIQIVKLEAKDGVRTWIMRVTSRGFDPLPKHEVFNVNVRPEPKLAENGHWILTLPQPLVPGQYGVVSDGDIWEFAVNK